MPRVIRRTPATEEAMKYGYRSFLQDIVAQAGRNVERMTSGGLGKEELLEMALAGVGAGTKIARGLGKGKFPFSVKTTDLPYWDGVLKKPAYYKKAVGLKRRIEFMSPEEYFDLIEKKTSFFRDTGRRAEDLADPKLIRKYAKEMREGAKFPMPGLEYRAKDLAQEGRHRMLAAKTLGIDRVPVLVMKSTPEQKLMERFSKEGLRYDAFTEPLPGYGYHQWTLYGEGPAKGATFGTKTTGLEEMERKIADLMRKFSK